MFFNWDKITMKKFALATALATLAVNSAVAADLSPGMYAKAAPAPAAYNWGGFYFGGDLGGAFARLG